jgi:peptide/nickel transport system substrate-binding protein
MAASPTTWTKYAKSIEVVDDYTVKITLTSFNNNILADMSGTGGAIVSPTATKTYGADYCLTHPVGTGPYKFVSYNRDVSVKWTRFDQCWHGKPYLDGYEVYMIQDPVTAKAAFLAGEGDMLKDLAPIDAIDLQKTGKFQFNTAMGDLVGLFGDGSHANSPFADIRVRQAIAYALDTKTITNQAGGGFFTQSNECAHPLLWSYAPDVKGYPYNVAKAKELLAAAGYPNGFKTTLYYQMGMVFRDQTALMAQQMLKQVGIDAAIDPLNDARNVQISQTAGWQNGMYMGGGMVTVGYSPFNALTRWYASTGPFATSRYKSPAIDDSLTKALAEPDQAKMVQLIQKAQGQIIDDYAVTAPMFISTYISAKYPYVHGGGINDPWSEDWRLWTLWMDKK